MEIDAKQSVAVCQYCGTRQTLPRLDSERIAGLYERAELLRRGNDFDKAAAVYEQIVSLAPNDAEANTLKTRQAISACRRSTACNLARFWRMRTICLRSGMPMTSRNLFTLQRPRRLKPSRRAIWPFLSARSRSTCSSATRKPTTTGEGRWIPCWQMTSITS